MNLSEQVTRRARQSRVAIIAAVALTLLACLAVLVAMGKEPLLSGEPADRPVASAGRDAG